MPENHPPTAKSIRNTSTRSSIERLFRIVGILQHSNRKNIPVTSTTLQIELEVDRATIMRDLLFLRDRLHLDIDWHPHRHSYILHPSSTHIPCMELTPDDETLLQTIHHWLASRPPTPSSQAMLQRFHHLFSILTGKNALPK